MALTKLHVLTPSTDATSTTSYEYFRNEELKRSENDELRVYGTNLGLHLDSVGRMAIGYGYDLQARTASISAATLAPYLAAGVTSQRGQHRILFPIKSKTKPCHAVHALS